MATCPPTAFKEADIYWFSGTGNTLLLARRIATTFRKRGIDVRLFRLDQSDPGRVDTNRALGIVVPVAMQGTFPFVWQFVRSLRPGEGTPVFFADTLLAYSGGILLPMKRFLRRAGYRPVGAREFLMPSNIFLRVGMTEGKRRRIHESLAKAEVFANALLDGSARWIDIPVYSDLMSSISRTAANWAFFRRITPLRIDHSRCSRCGLCVKLCPIGNIRMTGDGPSPNDGCVFCARCFSFCPRGAVSFDRYRSAKYRAVSALELLGG